MKESRESEALVLGRRIREARERLRWSQGRLAAEVGFNSAQIVSSIESGTRDVKASELSRIAHVLHTSVDNLINPDSRPESRFLWREQPREGFEEHEARFLLKCERYGHVEKWCSATTVQSLPAITFTVSSPSFGEVQGQAKSVRNALQLGGRPACSLAKTLEEDFGVKIFHDDLGPDGGAAFSVRSWFGAAVLLNSSQAPWRRNCSLAHELFHLLTADQLKSCGKEQTEKLANVFASALLIPSEQVLAAVDARREGGKISYYDLVEIAREFDVSIDALVWRLVNLRRLDKATAKEALASTALRAIDRASFPRWEPPPRLPDRFVRLCLLAYRRGKIGLAKLAEFLETNIVDLAEQVQETGAESATGEKAEIAVAGC